MDEKMSDNPDELGSITQEGSMAVIRIPMSEIHGLRVALRPCTCKAAKSISTSTIRERFDKGLARLQAKKR